MNNTSLKQIAQKALTDRNVNDGGFRLLMHILAERRADKAQPLDAPFPLPWKKVAEWCALTDRHSIYVRIENLSGYLERVDKPASPPVAWYRLLPPS